jgi:predicted Zn-dependent protease
MRRTLCVAVAALGLIGWVDPKTAAPTISEEATKAEAKKQALFFFNTRMREAERVDAVTFRLEAANQDLCADRAPRLGLKVNRADGYDKRIREAAVEALGLHEKELTVVEVVAGGPAAAAGVQKGDALVSINGQALAAGDKDLAEQANKRLDEVMKAAPQAPVTLVVQRFGESLTLTPTPVMACAYGVTVEDSPELNAFADGATIHVFRPILKLAGTDEELALVIAHELAHNGQHHAQAHRKNQLLGGLGGLVLDGVVAAAGGDSEGFFMKKGMQIGAAHASVAFESEADYVGMYYLARAGYSTAAVEDFWRKFAAEAPDSIFVKKDHPVSPERFLAIAATSQEIEAKRAKGEPLTPNTKSKQAAAAGG